VADPRDVRPVARVALACAAADDELLLVEWLNAIVFEMATRQMLFADFDVTIEDHRLTATAAGEEIDVERHQPAVEVKGATCTALKVSREGDVWVAQCVVDV
jgi:SHS2 domain-containing protein